MNTNYEVRAYEKRIEKEAKKVAEEKLKKEIAKKIEDAIAKKLGIKKLSDIKMEILL